MSSHCTRKAINLHHDQVYAGRARRHQRQVDRMTDFYQKRSMARWNFWVPIAFAVFLFCYCMIAIAVYLGYVL